MNRSCCCLLVSQFAMSQGKDSVENSGSWILRGFRWTIWNSTPWMIIWQVLTSVDVSIPCSLRLNKKNQKNTGVKQSEKRVWVFSENCTFNFHMLYWLQSARGGSFLYWRGEYQNIEYLVCIKQCEYGLKKKSSKYLIQLLFFLIQF